jgi:hypothetical protein
MDEPSIRALIGQGEAASVAQHIREAGQPLEERVQIQAIGVDLREAVCLTRGESRYWTIAELVERFKNLGVCCRPALACRRVAGKCASLDLVLSRSEKSGNGNPGLNIAFRAMKRFISFHNYDGQGLYLLLSLRRATRLSFV